MSMRHGTFRREERTTSSVPPPFFMENGKLTFYLWDSTVKTRSIFLWLSSSWCSFNCNFNLFTNFPFSTPKKIIFLTFNIDLGKVLLQRGGKGVLSIVLMTNWTNV